MKGYRAVQDALHQQGVVRLPTRIPKETLAAMQAQFERQLGQSCFNTSPGFQQNERYRLLLENLLTLAPAFYHPLKDDALMALCRDYLGPAFQMTEARGWQTVRTLRHFHGWHNDAWYDTRHTTRPPRQLKLGIYLTDVDSGEFCYLTGSHKARHTPGHWSAAQVQQMGQRIESITGPAGTVFLFDTCGIHRQNSPVLTPRNVVFYTFHDPATPIQALDRRFHRYAPLQLNAACLGSLTLEQQRILGFGDERYAQYQTAPEQRFATLHRAVQWQLKAALTAGDWINRLGQLAGSVRRRLRA
ncbi:phytanoyl-CoA dioxygenase family protein [Marinobacter hydrocarbonoclasticus]|nr:phytanoyl-CoA dioxygenase family protein [Marinobacter nauticus]